MTRANGGYEIHDAGEFRRALAELHRRQEEGLRLYRPMRSQLPFHLSAATERIIRGGVRSGKTGCAAAEVASAALGVPIIGPDGKELPFQYPREPLVIWVVGYDEKHIARIYRKLFCKGLYRVIKDRETGLLREWRPWEADDAARQAETKPSPPLIPERLVSADGCAWENKKEQVFSVIRLKNGAEIHAFASGGEAGQGDAVHLIWIDEDIKIPGHVDEWLSRLSDFDGRLIWSAWPHSANDALVRMSKRAHDQRGQENPDVWEVVLRFSDNPYIPAAAKRKRLAAWREAGAAVARSRDLGEFTTDTVLVFPSFSVDTHCLPSQREPDRLESFLEQANYEIPTEWTHYLALDPGHTQPAVAMAAVPPPSEFGRRLVIFDEVYRPRINAMELAAEVAARVAGRRFEAFVIDHRAGRQTTIGAGKRIDRIYSDAFRKYGLASRLTGHGFAQGSDQIAARNLLVQEALGPGDDGTPTIRLIAHRTTAMQREFGLYKKRVTKDDVREDVVDRNNHLMDTLAYLVAYGPVYVYHELTEYDQSPVLAAWRKIVGETPQASRTVFLQAGAPPEGAGTILLNT
ncbi:MAG TPA: hypothetical protein VMY42_06455 [Thermoguttaceae bacterium]|nr:hypothetical protein [Thermoguttaceae bacterium]